MHKCNFFKRRVDDFKKTPLEFITMAMCILLVIYVNFFMKDEAKDDFICNVLNFFCTFIFSWLFAKYSSQLEAKREYKKYAITAYRHNKSLITKVEYNIKLLDLIIDKKTDCNKDDGISCRQKENLFRLRDALISFKKDSLENLADWTSLISDDIAQLNDAKKMYSIYKGKLALSQDEDYTEEVDIQVAKSEYEKSRNKLNGEFKNILDSEITISDEMDCYIKDESRMQMKLNSAGEEERVFKEMNEILHTIDVNNA